MQVMVQFCFTTLFGWYAALVLVATGHLSASVAVHVFCNAMGFPALHAVRQHKDRVAVAAAFVAGMISFAVTFSFMKAPSLYNNTASRHDSNRYVEAVLNIR